MEYKHLLTSYSSSYGTATETSNKHDCENKSERTSTSSLDTYAIGVIASNEYGTAEIHANVWQTKILAVLTLIMTFILTILSFLIAQDSDSSAAFGFAADSFLAGLTSAIILWRFWSFKTLEKRNRKREMIALSIITVSLIVTGLLVGYRAIKTIVDETKHKKSIALLVVSTVSLVLYLILFILKYRLAKQLGCRALRTDSIDALCGAILSLSIVIATATREKTTKAWFLDPIIALGVAIFSIAYAIYSIVHLIQLRKRYYEFIKNNELVFPSECLYPPVDY